MAHLAPALPRLHPGPRWRAVVAAAIFALTLAGQARARAEDLPLRGIPEYRAFEVLIRTARESDSLSRLRPTLRFLAKRLGSLGESHGVDLNRHIQDAIVQGDRERVLRVVLFAALLESRDAAVGVERDRLTGWGTAKSQATVSYLTYYSAEASLRSALPEQAAKASAAFALLLQRLRSADLTTSISSVDEARESVMLRLKQAAHQLAEADTSLAGWQP